MLWEWLGLRPIEDVLALQENLFQQKCRGRQEQFLLFCEHPPCFTYAYTPLEDHLRIPIDEWRELHLRTHKCSRGGETTFHGPGQLVCYAVVDLHACGLNISKLNALFERVAAVTLLHYGLCTNALPLDVALARNSNAHGLWVEGKRKILSRGIRTRIALPIKHAITSFGFALNISVELHNFSYIYPCGLDIEMTSFRAERGFTIPSEEIARKIVKVFSRMMPEFVFREADITI